jgi:RNA polymerase sigma-70 factor (ECF subfamily)
METLYHKSGLSTDVELIQKIIEGETALFEVLIRRYNPLLYKIARTYGLNHQDAEDMMQEAHFTAYSQLKSFRKDASYKTWLTKIILHKCYHKVNYGSGKYEESDYALVNDNATFMHASSNKQDTERVIMNKELAAILEQSLQQLPVPYRSVFVLREIEGFPVAETAELLNITPTNVKVRLNRAKAMLQKQLEHFYTAADLYEFHLRYCDDIVKKVFQKIVESQG